MRIPRLALGLTLAFVLGACSGLYDVYRGSEPVQAALFAGDKLYLLTAKGDYEFSGIGTANLERFVRSPFSAKTTLSEWSLAAGRKTADESSYSVYIVPQDVSEKERQELLKTHSFELVEAAALKADVKKSIAPARSGRSKKCTPAILSAKAMPCASAAVKRWPPNTRSTRRRASAWCFPPTVPPPRPKRRPPSNPAAPAA